MQYLYTITHTISTEIVIHESEAHRTTQSVSYTDTVITPIVPPASGSGDKKQIVFCITTRSSATAEKQRVSCAHIPSLASWSVDDHAFTLGTRQNRRGCVIFWHSNALIHEMLQKTDFDTKYQSRSFKVIHFAMSYRPTKGCIIAYRIAWRISEVLEEDMAS